MYTLSYVLGPEFQNLKKVFNFCLVRVVEQRHLYWTSILCEKNSLDVAKEKQKALVTPLQLQNVFLQAVAPTKEHFQQGKYVSGKCIIFSVEQLSKHLTEVLELNQ